MRRRSRTTVVSVSTLLAGALALTPLQGALALTPPAAAPPPPEVQAAADAVASLATVLSGLADLPETAAPLPATGQTPADVLGLPTLFGRSLGAAAGGFAGAEKNQSFADLAQALSGADKDGLGVSAAASTVGGKQRLTLTLGGNKADGRLYLLYADDHLFLDGTPAAKGSVLASAAVSGSLVLDVDTTKAATDPSAAVTLSPDSALSVTLDGSADDLSVLSRYGFTDVTATGSATFKLDLGVAFVDPDGDKAISRAEWEQTLFTDLVRTTRGSASAAAVDLTLDSDLVPGKSDGAVEVALSGAAAMAPETQQDGSYRYAAPAVTAGQGLTDFGKVTSGDAVVGLAQMAAAYSTAQSRMDPQLPLLEKRLSELAAPADALNEVVEAQGAAAVVCGKADTSPPVATNIPGTTWYCQARTADAVQPGSVSWSVAGDGVAITGNKTSDATVGTSPTANITVTGSATEPDVAVTFKVAGDDGADISFTAQRRAHTAQELAARIDRRGDTAASVGYDPQTRALSWNIAVADDPAVAKLPINVGDLFRPKAQLRGVRTEGSAQLPVDIGKVTLAGTYGLLLEPAAGTELGKRAFLQVDADGHELEVAGISTAATGFSGSGSVGFVTVDVTGSGTTVSSDGMYADIRTGDALPAGDGTIPDAALLTDVLAGKVSGVTGEVLTGHVQLSAASTIEAAAPGLLAGSHEASMAYDLDTDTPTADPLPLPDVTPSTGWTKWVTPLDLTPRVAGRSSSDGSTSTLTDSSAKFLTRDLGIDFTVAGVPNIVNASLFNVTTGASCPTFKVLSETSLQCVEQEPTTLADADPTYTEGRMTGGKQADGDGEDNTWAPGDEYRVEGDPTTMRGLVLGGLYDIANGIEQSNESTWTSPLPMLGLTPHDLTPQLAKARSVATELNNVGETVRRENCAADSSCPAEGDSTAPPADLAALEKALEKKLGDGATVSMSITDTAGALGGIPHLVVRTELKDSGTRDAPLAFSLADAAPYSLKREMPAGDAGKVALPVSWSSTVHLDLALPLSPTLDPAAIKVLPTTGVSDLTVSVDDTDVDLTGSLGPVKVQIGKSAALSGTHTEPTGDAAAGLVLVPAGTAALSGTNSGTGTALTTADTDFGALVAGLTSGTALTVTNTTQSLTCTVGAATGSTATCDLGEGKSWAAGDAWTATYRSTTVLADTATDLVAAGVEKGQLVVVSTGTGTDRKDVGACLVTAVATHAATCDGLTGDAEFTTGAPATQYRVVVNALMDPAASFDKLGLEGAEVANTTDGSTCTVGSTTATALFCAAAPTGGKDNRWEPGDGYTVGAKSTVRGALRYRLSADVAEGTVPTVDSYVAALAGSVEGNGTAKDCGRFTPEDDTSEVAGDLCALLSVRTVPTADRPDGRYLGTVGFASDADGSNRSARASQFVSDLGASDVTLSFDLAGEAVRGLAQVLSDALDASVSDEPLPLLGYDSAGGTWLRPALDELVLQLSDAIPSQVPFEATVGDVDGDGAGTAGLAATIESAVSTAASNLERTGSDGTSIIPMGKLITRDGGKLTDVTLRCDGGKPCKDSDAVSAVEDMRVAFKVGQETQTYQVPFSAGLPGIPVSGSFLVDSKASWGVEMAVGVDRTTGPYVDTDGTVLKLNAHAELPKRDGGPACPTPPVPGVFTDAASPFKGYDPDRCQTMTLGILQGTAYDAKGDDARSQADLTTTVDLSKLAGKVTLDELGNEMEKAERSDDSATSVKASGRLNVYFVTGINPDVSQVPAGSLPSVHGTLKVQMNGGLSPEAGMTNGWSVDFENLYLDGGTFVNEFALPVFDKVGKYVKPYKPLIDAVRTPIPVLSDVAMMTGGSAVTLIDVLEKVSGNDLTLIRRAVEILDIVTSLVPLGDGKSALIPLGPKPMPYDPVSMPTIPGVDFSGKFGVKPKQAKSGPCGGAMTPVAAPTSGQEGSVPSPAADQKTRYLPKDCTSKDKGTGGYRGKTLVKQTQACDPTGGCTGKEKAVTITRWAQKPKITGTALTFPFLQDSSEVFGMLVGEDATLVRLDLGTLKASAGIGMSFGPFMAGPIPVDIGIGVSVTLGAHLALGYDTFGLRNALLTDPGTFRPEALLDGLYIDDFDANGQETPELFLTVAVKLEGAASLKIIRIGVYGGVSITITGDLNDPNNDGKMRIKEIRSYGDEPLCMFTLSGYLDFFLGFFVELDLWIKKIRQDVELWRLKPPLKLFEVKCQKREPVLAQWTGSDGGDLRLNIGTHAAARYIETDEINERFKVRQLSVRDGATQRGKTGTLVSVEAFGIYQEHLVPKGGKLVVTDAGGGRDTLEFLTGVDAAGTEHPFDVDVSVADAGDGNDTIVTGSGNDSVNGGAGNDRITLGAGTDSADGGDGADTVSGGTGDDTLNGGAGDDNLSGDAGADTVNGGGGNDLVAGGPGLDAAQLAKVKDREAKKAPGGKLSEAREAELDLLLDGADTLSGGAGDDTVTGHVGNDALFGDDPVTFSGARDFVAKACADTAEGGSGNDVLDGQVGSDLLAGGPGADQLTGGVGDDTLCGNDGADLLEGDDGPTGSAVGKDELLGGSGPDRVFGRAGTDVADGGPGDDLVDGGADHDVLSGGTGSDAITGAEGHDVILGDGGKVSGVSYATAAGVAGTGTASSLTDGAAQDSRVSDVPTTGSAGSVGVCATRAMLLRRGGVEGARVDVDGDGAVTSADDGRLDGYPVVDGRLDIDRDGDVADDADDAGAVAGLPVTLGLFQTPVDQAVEALLMTGTGDADCIVALAGNDAVFGGAAGDRIAGGFGRDLLDGGSGDDNVRGEQDDDTVRGGAGKDTLYGDSGADLVLGNDGDDTAYGGIGADQVEGNGGDDTLSGGDDADVLIGGTSRSGAADGDDDIDGGEGADRIAGDNASPARVNGAVVGLTLHDLTTTTASGKDTVHAGPGADTVYGQGGADTLRGGSESDRVEGGPGADRIDGDAGDDFLTGGSGYHHTAAGAVVELPGTPDGGDVINGGDGKDLVLGDNGIADPTRPFALFDVPTAPAKADLTVAGPDTIHGDAGDDRIFAQSGNDVAYGDAGDDDIAGNAGADDLSGGDGADRITGGSRTPGVTDDETRTVDGVLPSPVNDRIAGGPGADVISGDNAAITGDGTVTLHDVPRLDGSGAVPAGLAGTFGPDLVSGDDGSDRIWGQSGDDRLLGGGDADVVEGNSGADTVLGGDGADNLYGGSTIANVDDRAVGTGESRRGDRIEGGPGADVALGDNGLIEGLDLTSSISIGILTLPAVGRTVTLHDVEYAAKTARFPNASGPDQILGEAGADRLFGQGDGDTISGGSEDDLVSGGSGADTIDGDAGADDLVGGSGLADKPVDEAGVLDGADVIRGGTTGGGDGDEADVILGDNGRITRTGRPDPNTGDAERTARLYDLAQVGKPAPAAQASAGDRLFGDDDRDLVLGQGGDDAISGGAGDDWLEGNAGADKVHGDTGHDDVLGGTSAAADSDAPVAGVSGVARTTGFPVKGTDMADAGDELWGDDGDDVVLGDNGRVERTLANDGTWRTQPYRGLPLLVRQGVGAQAPEQKGAYGDDLVHGGNGHDELHGQLGDDTVEGNDGDDVLLGDLGLVTTTVNAGKQRKVDAQGFISDTVLTDGALMRRTVLFPAPTSVTAGGAGGKDTLLGGLGNDVVHGGAGDDTVWGNRSLVDGKPTKEDQEPAQGRDEDALFGDHGNDVMWGGWGHDHLYGGHGDDWLDVVTNLRGDPTVDFKGMDFMYGGWGQDAMQADKSQPNPSGTVDKMVDSTGAYNGYFVCEGAYGGNSVMRQLSPAMESFWQAMADSDGATTPATTNSSGWWELAMVFNSDRGSNANPVFDLNPAHFVCDTP